MRDCTSMRSGTYPARSNIGRRTFLAAFLVLCFLLGMIVGSWYPQWSECLSDVAVQGASTESDKVSARPIPQSDERNTEQVTAALLMELGAQRRLQERREEELRSEVREAEVALHLLCARGHAVDAPACREQVAKRRAAEAALTRLRVEAAEVAQLEAELRQAHEEDRARIDPSTIEGNLEGRIRLYLTRRSLMRQLAVPESASPSTRGNKPQQMRVIEHRAD